MTVKIKISYADLVNALLGNLPDREREVLQKRNALSNFPKYTLEQIGKDFNITRERVRQIEKEGLKKIKSLDFDKANLPINDLQSLIFEYLKKHGGAMAENHLMENLLPEQKAEEEKALSFILVSVLADKLARVDNSEEYHPIWKMENVNLDETLEVVRALKGIIEKHGKPLALTDLQDKFQGHELYNKVDQNEADNQAIIEALLRLRKDINRNILSHWGLNQWNTIRPKRMTDKAYLILSREKKPLHFATVADLINQANFDNKKACPATVHNELILDDKYVLVGRGIYALREWGYQEGTVADIIASILQDKGSLAKKDLIDEVLKQRIVQKTTITLALMDKNKFARTQDGTYKLAK